MNRRDIEDAIIREIDQWPLVSHEFGQGASHPRVTIDFPGAKPRFVVYPGSPGDERALDNVLADLRRELKALGAVRTKPPKAEAKPYNPGNNGRDARPRPEHERAEPRKGISDHLGGISIGSANSEPIGEPGEYDIPEDVYHSDPVVEPSCSASLVKTMWGRSPWHAWWSHPRLNPDFEREEHGKFDLGSAFHSLILGKGASIAVLDYADWRTKDAKAERDDARAQGLIPMLADQYERAEKMVRSAKAQMGGWDDLRFAMAGGTPERVLIWREETPSGSIWCRAMLDWVPHGGAYFPDWKTTDAGAGPDDWGRRTMWEIGCHIQEAFYRRGIRAIYKREADFIFPVVETSEPHAMMVHRVHKAWQADADRIVEWGLNVYAMCLYRNRWPGYPRETAWQEPPPWHQSKINDREAAGLMGEEYWVQALEALGPAEKVAKVGDDRVDEFGLLPVEN